MNIVEYPVGLLTRAARLNQPTPVAPGGCASAWSSGAFFIVELPERGLSDTWQLLTAKLQMAM